MNSVEKLSELSKRVGSSVQIFERKRRFWIFKQTLDLGHLQIRSLKEYWRINFSDNRLLSSKPISVTLYRADFCKENGEIKVSSLWIERLELKNYASSVRQIKDKEEIERVSNLLISKIDLAYTCNLGVPG